MSNVHHRISHSRSASSASSMASSSRTPSTSQVVVRPQVPPHSRQNSGLPPPHNFGGVIETNSMSYVKLANGRSMVNQYVLLARVGQGQHGTVYKCQVVNTGELVAIKACSRRNRKEERMSLLRRNNPMPRQRSDQPGLVNRIDNAEKQIFKEIAIMKKCDHGQIVSLYEVINDRLKRNVFMVQEFVAGGEVKWRDTESNPVLTVDQSRRICRDVILGLEYLHYQGIIHRDIKPANLLWTEDHDNVKIADFGVSHFSYAQRLAAATRTGDHVLGQDEEDPLLLDINDTELAKIAGSPSFLAPELIWEYTHSVSDSLNSSLNASASSSPTSQRSPDGEQPSNDSDSTIPQDIHPACRRCSAVPNSGPGPSFSKFAATPSFGERPPVTKAIDIWSLGVTLYCLLFGRCPWSGETEFVMYHRIMRTDFEIPSTMGFDRIPTSGRHPKEDDMSEGAVVVRLLDRMLQKDYTKRITLDELKRHKWILRDIPHPERWLRETAPDRHGAVSVSADEETVALSEVRFRWKDRLAARLTNLFFGRPRRTQITNGASRTASRLRTETRRNRDDTVDPDRRQSRSENVRGPGSVTGTGRPHIVTRNLSKGRAAAHSAMGRVDKGVKRLNRRPIDKTKSTSDLPRPLLPPSREHSRERDHDRRAVSTAPTLGLAKKISRRRSSSRVGRKRGSSLSSPTVGTGDEPERIRSRMSLTFYKQWIPRWPGSGARSPASDDDQPGRAGPSTFASIVERRSADEIMAASQQGGASSRSRSVTAGFSDAMRASSWGEFAEGRTGGVYDDLQTNGCLSDEDSDLDDSLGGDLYGEDNNVMMMVGAGGVLSPPGSPNSSSSVSLYTPHSPGTMGETVYSQQQNGFSYDIGGPSGSGGNYLQALPGTLVQREHLFDPSDLPVEPNPALLETIGHEQRRHTRHQALSPLAQAPYVLDDREISVFGDVNEVRDDDDVFGDDKVVDEDVDGVGSGSGSGEGLLRGRRAVQVYDDDDDEDDDSSEEEVEEEYVKPITIRRRRPSETLSRSRSVSRVEED